MDLVCVLFAALSCVRLFPCPCGIRCHRGGCGISASIISAIHGLFLSVHCIHWPVHQKTLVYLCGLWDHFESVTVLKGVVLEESGKSVNLFATFDDPTLQARVKPLRIEIERDRFQEQWLDANDNLLQSFVRHTLQCNKERGKHWHYSKSLAHHVEKVRNFL